MREITAHRTNACNSAIAIEADERDPENGNASHEYFLTLAGEETFALVFQHGPIAEVGVNGITNEALLAIVMDRLEGFQSGRYACEENADALDHVRAALNALDQRTQRRIARGVEGTHEV